MMIPNKLMKALEEGLIEFGMENYDKGVNDAMDGLIEGLEAYAKYPSSDPNFVATMRLVVEEMKMALEQKRCRTRSQTLQTSKPH